jgi:hypothetical protein
MTEERGANVRVPPPLVFLVFLIIGIGLSYVWPLQTHLAVSARLTIAIASGAAALAVIISCVSLFRKSGQNARPWTPAPSLVIGAVPTQPQSDLRERGAVSGCDWPRGRQHVDRVACDSCARGRALLSSAAGREISERKVW